MRSICIYEDSFSTFCSSGPIIPTFDRIQFYYYLGIPLMQSWMYLEDTNRRNTLDFFNERISIEKVRNVHSIA